MECMELHAGDAWSDAETTATNESGPEQETEVSYSATANATRSPSMHDTVAPSVTQADDASPLVQVTLTPEDAARVMSELSEMESVNYDAGIGKFEELSAIGLGRSVPWLVEFLRVKLDSAAAIRIQGFDFGAVYPTSEGRCSHKTNIPAAVAAGLAHALGFGLVGYNAEKIYTHPWFHDIRPVKGGKEGSNGAGEPLNFHMDMSYEFTKAPEWLVLVCLREGVDPNVKTPFVQNSALFRQLMNEHPEDIEVLKDPTSYNIQQPDSAGGGIIEGIPLLTGDNEDEAIFWLRVHHDRIVPRIDSKFGREKAAAAFSHLQGLLDKVADDSIHLIAGDVFLVNNMKSLHKRTEFKAAFSGEDRLLVRSYFKDRKRLPESRMF